MYLFCRVNARRWASKSINFKISKESCGKMPQDQRRSFNIDPRLFVIDSLTTLVYSYVEHSSIARQSWKRRHVRISLHSNVPAHPGCLFPICSATNANPTHDKPGYTGQGFTFSSRINNVCRSLPRLPCTPCLKANQKKIRVSFCRSWTMQQRLVAKPNISSFLIRLVRWRSFV